MIFLGFIQICLYLIIVAILITVVGYAGMILYYAISVIAEKIHNLIEKIKRKQQEFSDN